MVFSYAPPPPHVEHLRHCPRHPDNLQQSALTLPLVPDCLASCPRAIHYHALPPFKQQIQGLFNEPYLSNILYDFYASRSLMLATGEKYIVAERKGLLYVWEIDRGFRGRLRSIPNMVSLQTREGKIIAINKEGAAYTWELSSWPSYNEPGAFLAPPLQASYAYNALHNCKSNTSIATVAVSPYYPPLILTLDGQVFDLYLNEDEPPLRLHGDAKAIARGSRHSMVLLENGEVMSWGENGQGQFGCGDTESSVFPVASATPKNRSSEEITTLYAGRNSSFIQFKNGDLFSCGDNTDGVLGSGDISFRQTSSWIAVKGLPTDTQFSLWIENHALALDENGKLWGWGTNRSGQLGRPPENIAFHSAIKVAQEHEGGIIAAAGSYNYTAILVQKGDQKQVYKTNPKGQFELIMDLAAVDAALPAEPPSAAALSAGSSATPPRAP
jgi:hypothetical protein